MRTQIYLKNRPEVKGIDLSQRLYERRKLSYDENHRLVIVPDGVEDVQASIDAASCLSLSELCASMPGRGPLEKLNAALDSGILGDVSRGDPGSVNDFTEAPQNIQDLYDAGRAAREIVGQKGDLAALINEYVKKAMSELSAQSKASEGENEK